MSFAFQYSEKIDPQSLFQGDLLVKNAALRTALAQAHAYYADATDYTHFMVLTQSCDLVRRGGKPPKSRYITLAAARPLTVVVDRLISKAQLPNPPTFPLALCDASRKVFIRQALERLLHNTENGYFFLRANSHKAIDIDLCVFLPLSVALRADHYNTCLEAKILQLSDVFQAKVGWLAGDLYSKVGTLVLALATEIGFGVDAAECAPTGRSNPQRGREYRQRYFRNHPRALEGNP